MRGGYVGLFTCIQLYININHHVTFFNYRGAITVQATIKAGTAQVAICPCILFALPAVDMVGEGCVVIVCTTTVVLFAADEMVFEVLLVRLAADDTVVTLVDCDGGRVDVRLEDVEVLVDVVWVLGPVVEEVLVPGPEDVVDDDRVVGLLEDVLGAAVVPVPVLLPVPVFGTK